VILLQAVTAYKRHLRDAVNNLGATSTAADRFSDETFHFEKRIAEITPSPVDLQDPTHSTIVTVEKLKILAPSVSQLCYEHTHIITLHLHEYELYKMCT
jgi:hypothetical protein